jgi:hypothetical protein
LWTKDGLTRNCRASKLTHSRRGSRNR